MSSIFDIILYPLGYIVRICYAVIPNYAVALFLFAVIIKLILFPLGIKQQKNSVKQASLQPKEQAIRKKYAGRTDKPTQMKMNEEIQQLYQAENFNMFGGCLPLLVQFPILIALYNVIRNPLQYIQMISTDVIDRLEVKFIELYKGGLLENVSEGIKTAISKLSAENITSLTENASSLKFSLPQIDMVSTLRSNPAQFSAFGEIFEGTKIQAVTDLPNFTLFGVDFSQTPTFALSILMLIPILTFVASFLGMRITRKFTYQPQQTGDAAKSMQIMDWTMPLLSVWITFSVPAAIGLYWIYQNILSTLQQIILVKLYPIPKFSEDDFKEAERKYGGTISKKEKKKTRSLHRIDEEDEQDEFEQKSLNAPVNKNRREQAEGGDSGIIEKASLKDENKNTKGKKASGGREGK